MTVDEVFAEGLDEDQLTDTESDGGDQEPQGETAPSQACADPAGDTAVEPAAKRARTELRKGMSRARWTGLAKVSMVRQRAPCAADTVNVLWINCNDFHSSGKHQPMADADNGSAAGHRVACERFGRYPVVTVRPINLAAFQCNNGITLAY